ncbi:MAG: hypothetical protein KBA66_07745 [Leptospiraceae bacterium]|nr:hypothetical protein [Leptospiraceae bacterium]
MDSKKYSVGLNRKILSIYLSIGIGIFAIYKAFIQHWVCDDAFISFRYAKNLTDGLGLVYNAGEFVEGYTNFLWTIFLSVGMFFHLDPIHVSAGLGILFYFLTLFVLYKTGTTAYEIRAGKRYKSFYFPIAFAGFALHSHGQIFATGGLETSLFSFLLLAGTVFLLLSNRGLHLLTGFFLLVLAIMTRPDGALFYIFAFLYTALFKFRHTDYKTYFTNQLALQLPFIFIFLPYWIWRYTYFGWFFPNTFYAKSGMGTYLEQGIKYILLYFNSYYVLYLPFVLVFFWFLRLFKISSQIRYFFLTNFSSAYKSRRRKIRLRHRKLYRINPTFSLKKIISGQSRIDNFYVRIFILFLLPSFLYIVYLTKIGGDFMFARLLIPITPLLYLTTELFLFRMKFKRVRILLSILVILGTGFYYNPYKGTDLPIVDNITNESDIYKLKNVYQLKLSLLPFRKIFEEEEINIAYGGSQAMLAYYLNPKVAIEAVTGLTDEFVAHQIIAKRGKVGHEKPAPISYLLKRNIHIHFFPTPDTPKTDYNSIRLKNIPGEFRIIRYDSALFSELKKTKLFEFQRFETYLDKYISEMDKKTRREIQKDYLEFKKYYFDWNEDDKRERVFLE